MYLVPEEILQAVFNYLATKPYNEVANLISALQSAQKQEVKDAKKISQ